MYVFCVCVRAHEYVLNSMQSVCISVSAGLHPHPCLSAWQEPRQVNVASDSVRSLFASWLRRACVPPPACTTRPKAQAASAGHKHSSSSHSRLQLQDVTERGPVRICGGLEVVGHLLRLLPQLPQFLILLQWLQVLQPRLL